MGVSVSVMGVYSWNVVFARTRSPDTESLLLFMSGIVLTLFPSGLEFHVKMGHASRPDSCTGVCPYWKLTLEVWYGLLHWLFLLWIDGRSRIKPKWPRKEEESLSVLCKLGPGLTLPQPSDSVSTHRKKKWSSVNHRTSFTGIPLIFRITFWCASRYF